VLLGGCVLDAKETARVEEGMEIKWEYSEINFEDWQ